jgi:REP element-mobilizing transposase RayT
MSRALRIQYPGAYYHVTCRGNERREIFRDEEDQKAFFRLLARSIEVFDVRLFAYALLPNHFHLLICTPKGNLSQFMRHFNISYTGSFNRKYQRSGHLYQGRYKAFLIDADSYLLEVSRYIHLNPLRMRSKEPLEKRWQDLLINDSTSLPGYLDPQHRKSFVFYSTILEYFGSDSGKAIHGYKEFVAEAKAKDLPSPLEKGKGTGVVGKEDFLEEIKQLFGQDRRNKEYNREQPALRELGKVCDPDDLIDAYAKLLHQGREELTTKGKQSTERAILMELLYRLCGMTQPSIGKLLGDIDYSAVSQARKRLHKRIENDPELGRTFHDRLRVLGEMSRIKI